MGCKRWADLWQHRSPSSESMNNKYRQSSSRSQKRKRSKDSGFIISSQSWNRRCMDPKLKPNTMLNLKTQDFIPVNHKLLWFEQNCAPQVRFMCCIIPHQNRWRTDMQYSVLTHFLSSSSNLNRRVSMGSGNQMMSGVHNQICHRSWCDCSPQRGVSLFNEGCVLADLSSLPRENIDYFDAFSLKITWVWSK